MIIEICSRADATAKAAASGVKTSVISITSTDGPDVSFAENPNIESILRLKFNDLTEEYDEEGIPYGIPLPAEEDFAGLKDFVKGLTCEHLIVHCHEGTSRSAAVAAAVYRFRECRDTLRTNGRFAPNRLVYALACGELGIRQGDFLYRLSAGEDGILTVSG